MNGIEKRKLPTVVWAVVVAATLWSPAVHLFKFLNTPHAHTYTFVQGRDPSGWIWAIESPKENYLASIVLERDVNIFLRSDALAHIFVPYGWIAMLLGIPSPFMLILIEMLWNGLCAWATYHFFLIFLESEKTACAALVLTYFASGISGTLLALNWLVQGLNTGTWQHAFFPPSWVGEHHVLSFEFYEGNQLITLTSLNRPYYMMARFFGLYALIALHQAAETAQPMLNKRKAWLSCLYLFIAAVIHPASALIFGVMAATWTAVYATARSKEQQTNVLSNPAIQAGSITLLGLILATILWKFYQQIPEVKLSVAQYTGQLFNAEAMAIWTGVSLLAFFSFAILMQQKKHRLFYILILLACLTGSIGLSEFVIKDYAVKSRMVWLALSIGLLLFALLSKGRTILNWIQVGEKTRTAVLFGSWTLAIVAIAVSPHHDALKVIEQGTLNLGALTEPVKKVLELGSLVYAARFKLGIWVPLSGLCAFLIYEYGLKALSPNVALGIILALSLPSQLAYTWRWMADSGGYMGYIPKSHAEAFEFMKQRDGRNVMCAVETGWYILNGANKRPILGYGEDRVEEKKNDVQKFFQTDDAAVQQEILKKYKINYIFLSEHERKLAASAEKLSNYAKVYDNGDVQVFEVPIPITSAP
ncbi:MAG: hypothetical protein ACK41G_06005 [Candidatus Thermochlorobacter sp.]